ncbi:hypothetical protein GCM10022263_17110 [Nocardioides daeguensis]|uniref:Uncharacterized protein n=1 Tax=Nocardioides daeguensis TaxID=908359 RepID=A0ABP6V529_9ACTN
MIGTNSATSVPTRSARLPVTAEASDWPTMTAEPRIVITVADRPTGLRSAPRLYWVTIVGPMPQPMSNSTPHIAATDETNGSNEAPTSIVAPKTSQRARSEKVAGNSATPRASAAEPIPITPYTRPAEAGSPWSAMNAVSEVSIEPKNSPTPKMPATTASSAGRAISRTGAGGVARSSAPAAARAEGCSAKAVTNTSVSRAAPATGAHGSSAVASRPTTNGPMMNTISSAADS